MQGARDQFLAGARLARDQHRHAGARQPADGAEHLLHRRRLAENLGNRTDLRFRQRGIRALVRGTPHQVQRMIDVEGFGQIFEGAALIRGDRAVQVRMRRHHDHGQARARAVDLLEQIQTVASRHADIGDEHIGCFGAQRLQHAVRLFERLGVHAALFQSPLQHPADRGVVVNQPDLQCA